MHGTGNWTHGEFEVDTVIEYGSLKSRARGFNYSALTG